MILTQSKYGYELMTSDGRFFVIDNNSGKYKALPLKIKSKDQMTGKFIKNIPDSIKNLVFKLQKSE